MNNIFSKALKMVPSDRGNILTRLPAGRAGWLLALVVVVMGSIVLFDGDPGRAVPLVPTMEDARILNGNPGRAVPLVPTTEDARILPLQLGAVPHSVQIFEACLENRELIYSPSLPPSQDFAMLKAVERGEDSPQIKISGIPTERATAAVALQGYYIYKEPYYLANLGHVLGDDIFTIFHLMYYFNLQDLDRSLVHVVLPDETGSLQAEISRNSVIKEMYQLITPNEIIYANFKKTFQFQHLLTGWNDFSYSFNRFPVISKLVVEEFYKRVLHRYGLKIEGERNMPCKVLIINKDIQTAEHKFTIENPIELRDAIRSDTTCDAEVAIWQGMNLEEQVKATYKATIVVALPGSDIMNCIFQPVHSGMIVPERCNSDTGKCEGSNEIRLWYSRMPYRRIQSFRGLDNPGLTWTGNKLYWQPSHLVSKVLEMKKSISLLLDTLDPLTK